MLQPEQRGHQVIQRLAVVGAVSALIDQQKRLIRLKALQPVRRRLYQGPDFGGRPPTRFTVIEPTGSTGGNRRSALSSSRRIKS